MSEELDIQFDEDFLKESKEEVIKREQEAGGDKREKIEAGVQSLYIVDVVADVSKKGKVPMIKIEHNTAMKDAETRPINKFFLFNTKDPEKLKKHMKMFFEYLYRGFGYTLKPGDLKSAVKQAQKFKSKKLKCAVQVKQDLYKKYDDEGEVKSMQVVDNPEIWYVGQANEDLSMKEEKKRIGLTDDKKEEYADWKEEHGEEETESDGITTDEKAEEVADSDEPKAEKAPKEEKEESSGGGGIDDLPF